METIQKQVRDLADRAAIVDLVTAYSTALDSRTWDLWPIFDHDMVWEYPGVREPCYGTAAVVAMMRASLEPLDATQHLVSNHVIALHGDEAGHTCYFHATHIRRGLPGGEIFIGAGRYEDRLRRTPDGWRFTRRSLHGSWTFGNPAVLSR